MPEAVQAEILQSLRAGVPVPAILEKIKFLAPNSAVGISASMVYRLRYSTGTSSGTVEPLGQVERDALVDSIGRVRAIADDARSVRESANAHGMLALALKASNTELAALKDLREDLGVSVEDAGQTIADAHALLSAAGAVVRSHPELAGLLADAVERRGAQALASDIRQAAAKLAVSRKGNS